MRPSRVQKRMRVIALTMTRSRSQPLSPSLHADGRAPSMLATNPRSCGDAISRSPSAGTLESHAREQLPQLVIAPLDIANRIGRHSTLEARVETPILYRFRDVLGGDGGAGCKIRNRARDTQHAVIRARREQEAGERLAQELVAVAVGRAMTVYLTRGWKSVVEGQRG